MTHLSSVLFASLSLSVAACAIDDVDVSSMDQAATGELGLHGAPEPHEMPQLGYLRRPGSVSLLSNHGGPVLTTSKTMAIFWGNWTDPTIAGDKIDGLDTFFNGFNHSTYANTNTEYSSITNQTDYLGHVFDATQPPSKALNTSQAVAEACKMAGTPDPAAVYFIYTSTGAGHVSYCAWHTSGTCSDGTVIQVAYMPNIDNVSGCNPNDTYGGGHSVGLAALANVTGHELSEAITDPHLNAWYDNGGNENADKCAWKFAGPVNFSTPVLNPDGTPVLNADGTPATVNSTWKIQMNWSNAAYNASRADDGLNRGCIQTN